MEVPCSYTTSSTYTRPSKATQGDAGGFADAFGAVERDDLEQMLENLCQQDPSIAKRVSENEDGSYNFDTDAYKWSEKSFVARALVLELNDQDFSLIGNEGMIYPSDGDRSLFKQMTGYNMLILGGACVVLDDEGFPPTAADKSSVQQAADFVVDVACYRHAGYMEGELSAENIGALLAAWDLGPGTSPFIDQLMKTFDVSPADLLGFSEAVQQSQMDELIALASTMDDHEGAEAVN